MLFGPHDQKYLFPAFSAFPYRRSWKHVTCKETTLSIVGPKLRLVLGFGGGAGTLILLSTQAAKWTLDWLRITMGHTKKSDWCYRSKVMCAKV